MIEGDHMINIHHKHITIITLLIVLHIFSESSISATAKGWLWYDTPEKVKRPPVHKKSNSPLTKLKNFQHNIAIARARAIFDPTPSNVRQYILLQNYIVEKASRFSQIWELALLENPDLNYHILHPTENLGLKIMHHMHNQAQDQAIAILAHQYGLFYFYKGNDALSSAMAPVISEFSKIHHIALMSISVDGYLLTSLPLSKPDKGQAQSLGIRYFPALVLVDPKARKVKPLHYGFISGDELRQRFLDIAQHFSGDM